MKRSSWLSALVLALASLIGLWAFFYPFLEPPPSSTVTITAARAGQAPLVFAVLLALALLVTVVALESRRLAASSLAVLGVLVAVNAILRLVAGPGGASAVFFLPILTGFVFGADFGFLLASLSMLASGLLSGVGPWLPFQMLAAGWGGMIAGWLPRIESRPRVETALLASWGAIFALFYGAVTNLWFWPVLDASGVGLDPALGWDPGLSLRQSLARYGVFYLTTSLWWDLARSAGNVLLLVLLGPAVLRLLDRFRRRFDVHLEG